MIGARTKLQFAVCLALAYWLVADVRRISLLHLLLAGTLLAGTLLLVSALGPRTAVRLLYGPRPDCTPL